MVQLVDATLHAQIAAGSADFCALLEKLKLGAPSPLLPPPLPAAHRFPRGYFAGASPKQTGRTRGRPSGVADNYDYVYFMAAGVGYYTSVHMNTHQEAVPGTVSGMILKCTVRGPGGVTLSSSIALTPPGSGCGHRLSFLSAFRTGWCSLAEQRFQRCDTDRGGGWRIVLFPKNESIPNTRLSGLI